MLYCIVFCSIRQLVSSCQERLCDPPCGWCMVSVQRSDPACSPDSWRTRWRSPCPGRWWVVFRFSISDTWCSSWIVDESEAHEQMCCVLQLWWMCRCWWCHPHVLQLLGMCLDRAWCFSRFLVLRSTRVFRWSCRCTRDAPGQWSEDHASDPADDSARPHRGVRLLG